MWQLSAGREGGLEIFSVMRLARTAKVHAEQRKEAGERDAYPSGVLALVTGSVRLRL